MSIVKILMDRDSMSKADAVELVRDARRDLFERLESGEMPDDICADWFGLEPDYIYELMGYELL